MRPHHRDERAAAAAWRSMALSSSRCDAATARPMMMSWGPGGHAGGGYEEGPGLDERCGRGHHRGGHGHRDAHRVAERPAGPFLPGSLFLRPAGYRLRMPPSAQPPALPAAGSPSPSRGWGPPRWSCRFPGGPRGSALCASRASFALLPCGARDYRLAGVDFHGVRGPLHESAASSSALAESSSSPIVVFLPERERAADSQPVPGPVQVPGGFSLFHGSSCGAAARRPGVGIPCFPVPPFLSVGFSLSVGLPPCVGLRPH